MTNSKHAINAVLGIISLVAFTNVTAQVTPGFTMPAAGCINSPITLQNTSVGASTYYWNFCASNYSATPTVENIGNPGNLLSGAVFMDYTKDQDGNYFAFVTNYTTGNLTRLSFGNSILNVPSATNLGNFGGILGPEGIEGIKLVYNENKWYAIIVGSNKLRTVSKMVKISFGNSLANPSPVATDWGNFAQFDFPHDLFVFKEGSTWYAYVVNKNSSTISLVNFTSSFDNPPSGVNVGNLGSLKYPAGLAAISVNGVWHLFIANSNEDPNGFNSSGGSITRLIFGNGLITFPTGVFNLGNLGIITMARDISLMNVCGSLVGFVANQKTKDIIKLDFTNGIANIPTASSLGTFSYYEYPHSISRLFRNGSDIYFFVVDIQKNSLSRLKFQGCNNSDIPASTASTPPSIMFNAPGTYTVNLTVDEGLATEASICKQITLSTCVTPILIKDFQASKSVSEKNIIAFETLEEASAREIWVERAYTDMKFSSIASIALKGDGRYTFTDESNDKNQAIVFYRLKVVSKSSEVTYSEVKSLKSARYKGAFSLSDNLFKGRIAQLNIISTEYQNVQINVYDGSGRLMVSKSTVIVQGKNYVDFSNEAINTPGIYFVQIKSGTTGATFRLLLQ